MKLRYNLLCLFIAALLFLPFFTEAQKKQDLSKEELKTWWQKDVEQDTIPGISLNRAYNELLQNRKGEEVIVAVLDTKMDIDHEDLKQQLWVNVGEIPNNGIDDDKNGYIDDVNGWNFLGNSKGEDVVFQQAEVTRIVKKYKSKYENRLEEDFSEVEKKEYSLYMRARKAFEMDISKYQGYIKYYDSTSVVFRKANDIVSELLSRDKFDISEVDSLAKVHTELEDELSYFSELLKYGDTEEGLKKLAIKTSIKLNASYGLNVDERALLNDDPHSLSDVPYGNNILINNSLEFQHSTAVSGVLCATRENNLGINGVSNNIKIMPVVMVAEGDEYDKEVALAIKYAVDNGADIINMSWGKYFSIHPDWVKEAFQYAAKNNVLMVSGAGNNHKNIDFQTIYPIDNSDGVEFVDNFIKVGATTHRMDSTLVAWFSNYGKMDVDIFAPGAKIYSTDIENEYRFSDGTSIASPITAGVAALVKSYYPKLTAAELKMIVIESGTPIKLDMKIRKEDNTMEMMQFSELSKSGKILNAYNALILAEKISNSND